MKDAPRGKRSAGTDYPITHFGCKSGLSGSRHAGAMASQPQTGTSSFAFACGEKKTKQQPPDRRRALAHRVVERSEMSAVCSLSFLSTTTRLLHPCPCKSRLLWSYTKDHEVERASVNYFNRDRTAGRPELRRGPYRQRRPRSNPVVSPALRPLHQPMFSPAI